MSRKALAKRVRDDIARVAIELGHTPTLTKYLESGGKYPEDVVTLALGSYETGCRAAGLDSPGAEPRAPEPFREPKILLFDIETSPYLCWTWGLWDQNVALNQIVKERHLLSFAAKWYGQPYVLYKDQSKESDISNDKALCETLAALFNEADIIISQNGKKFDERFVKGRMLLHGLKPYRPFVHVDVLVLSRKFDLTSRKLEYMSEKFSPEHKKLKHEEFPGMELWKECMGGNQLAWEVMREYNRNDVLSLEPVYEALRPWGIGVNLNAFHSATSYKCQCGSEGFQRDPELARTATGQFERFQCKRCGAWHTAKGATNNYISGHKKESMKSPKG